MAYRFSPEDVTFLTGAAGTAALAALDGRACRDDTLIADISAARKMVGGHAAAVVETIRLRRRALDKIGGRASGWLFTDEALQQASPWPVAMLRAERFAVAGVGVHDVTCSIGTDLVALAAAGVSRLLGSDLDGVRLAMAAHQSEGVPLVRADALRPVSRSLVPYADPARRAGGRRITGIETVPSVDQLEDAWAGTPPVLRLPPGIDYETLGRPGEVQIVSLDGSARESVLWPQSLAENGIRRRATILTSAAVLTDTAGDRVHRVDFTDRDDDGGGATAAGPVGDWIVDPDPAVVRAHLVRHFGARHGLHLLDAHLAYLTGSTPPPGMRAFRVLDTAPFTERTVAGWARRDGVGTLEIKQRGTPVVPDELRRRLRPALSGDTRVDATLIVARVGPGSGTATAYWCRATVSAR